MRAIFIRHGESTGNAGIPCDDLSKIILTAKGHAQAEAIATGWKEQPSLIAVSPYVRTHLTAQPTLLRFPRVPVEVLPMEEFTYLEPSRWNGTSRTERLPSIEAYWKAADPLYCDGPGAESFSTLLRRVEKTLARFEMLQPDSLILAFSHGLLMQAVRVSAQFPEWSDKQKMEYFWSFNAQHPIPNAGLVAVRCDNGLWTMDGAYQLDKIARSFSGISSGTTGN